ncbi:MAG TPA: hypothetical protein VNI20_00895, partial [Fimbriimonadaceae bacterium]|nr:hypothetical protein [Fimbriimonadaceae bacterium]
MHALLTLTLALNAPSPTSTDVQRRATGDTQTVQIKARSFYTARIAKTPDINQHMTFEQFLKQIPTSLQKKYTPPPEIGLKTKVFFENFCGPCAVADNLMYLRNFFPQMTAEADPVAGGTF